MGRERFLRFFEKDNRLVPRGELWVAGEVLRELGFAQRQDSLISLAARVGADICFFSYSSSIQALAIDSGEMDDLVKKGHASGLACGVTVDGPFERMIGELGFMGVMNLFQDEAVLEQTLHKHALLAAAEMTAAEMAGADLIVLCDDIAYNRGLYFSPGHFKTFILPLYRRLRRSVSGGTLLGFHSDGNIESIISGLYAEGYSFFSVEPEAMNLIKLSAELPGDMVIMSGIRADWLVGPEFGEQEIGEIQAYVSSLRDGCRIVFSSACGIFNLLGLERLERIYRFIGSRQDANIS